MAINSRYKLKTGEEVEPFPPIQNTDNPYLTEAAMHADQANQLEGYGYLVDGVGAFTFSKTYNSLEDAQQDLSKQKVGRNYKISDKIYRLESDSNYRELTIEDLGTFSPILFPEEYVPTEQEAKSIPFPTSEYIEFHWNRLYGKSWRPEEYVDDGWQPDWMNNIKK